MKLNRDELKDACFAVAASRLWFRSPEDVERIQAMADIFFKTALDHEEFIVEQGRDPNLIVRAVRYLDHIFATPPANEEKRWFYEQMHLLIELACPNTGSSRDQELFYQDIEAGIAEARADYDLESGPVEVAANH